MKKAHLCFRAYLAALLMLTAVPAKAADVKELFAIDLADYPGKEVRVIVFQHPIGTPLRIWDKFVELFGE